MSRLRQFLIWFGCGSLLAMPLHYAVGVALAALENAPLSATGLGVNKKAPVLLDAEKLGYDRRENVAVAEGNVELTQGETILLADRIAYNQATGVVIAQGNIRVLDQDGNTFFADEVELTEGFREGAIDNFRARLSDDSLFAAREARKINENVTELDHAVYSPCKICYGETDKDPLWQLKAEHVTIDQAEQRITYRNAFMEVYGVPVLYTPYFSHPTPGADNKSGILIPQYGQSGNLGAVAKLPVYFALAPDKDMTLTPIFTSDEGPVLAGEYRQMFDNGQMEFSGSFTYPEKRDGEGNPVAGHEIRGHIRGKGDFGLRENWGWGFDVNRATDDTYLRKYEFGNEDTLTSRLYLEGLKGRGYAIAQALSFQGLRADDDPDTIPLVAPLVDMEYETEPGAWNSRFFAEGNAMSLIRDVGAESRRLSVTGGWRAPWVTQGGQVFELSASLRADGYTVSDVMTSGGTEEGTTGRLAPELALRWRYPLINRMEHSSLIVEPVVNTIVSAHGGNPEAIPNEDNVAPEFTDTNIFDDTHFAGYDRVETGTRVNYGLRSQWRGDGGTTLLAQAGQNYHTETDNPFPYSRDPGDHFSDYVGRLAIQTEPVELSYRFRLDRDGLDPVRHEFTGQLVQNPVSLTASYIRLDNDIAIRDSEEILSAANWTINDSWALSAFGRRDLLNDGRMIEAGGGLTWHNECVTLLTGVRRDFTRDREVEPSTSFTVRLLLKNL